MGKLWKLFNLFRWLWSSFLWILLFTPLYILMDTWKIYLKGIKAGSSLPVIWTVAFAAAIFGFRIMMAFSWASFDLTFLHELAHAIFARLNLVKIEQFHVHNKKGGLLEMKGVNFPARIMIALAPYFFSPLYLIVLLKPWLTTSAIKFLIVVIGIAAGLQVSTLMNRTTWRQQDLKVLPMGFSIIVILLANISVWVLIMQSIFMSKLNGIAQIYTRIWKLL